MLHIWQHQHQTSEKVTEQSVCFETLSLSNEKVRKGLDILKNPYKKSSPTDVSNLLKGLILICILFYQKGTVDIKFKKYCRSY